MKTIETHTYKHTMHTEHSSNGETQVCILQQRSVRWMLFVLLDTKDEKFAFHQMIKINPSAQPLKTCTVFFLFSQKWGNNNVPFVKNVNAVYSIIPFKNISQHSSFMSSRFTLSENALHIIFSP